MSEVLIRLNDQDRADALASILETIVQPGAEGDDAILVENVVAQLRGELRPLLENPAEPGDSVSTMERSMAAAAAENQRWLDHLKEPLARSDLDTCPACGSSGDYWLREIGKRFTWQPLAVAIDDDRGDLIESDYLSFDYGDDVEVDYWECHECCESWDSLADLQHALVSAKHARQDAVLIPLSVTPPERALADLICNTRTRAVLERHDPQALEHARRALGLPVPPKKEESNG